MCGSWSRCSGKTAKSGSEKDQGVLGVVPIFDRGTGSKPERAAQIRFPAG